MSPNHIGADDREPTLAEPRPLRLLIPIDARERTEWGLRYARRRHDDGRSICAVLLAVAEPVVNLHVLRFRTERQAADFLKQRAQDLLGHAAAALGAAGVAVDTHFREGEIAFSILDTAEELGCDEIVMPAPQRGLLAQLLFPDAVAEVVSRQRRVPVVTVDAEGRPEPARTAAVGRPAAAFRF